MIQTQKVQNANTMMKQRVWRRLASALCPALPSSTNWGIIIQIQLQWWKYVYMYTNIQWYKYKYYKYNDEANCLQAASICPLSLAHPSTTDYSSWNFSNIQNLALNPLADCNALNRTFVVFVRKYATKKTSLGWRKWAEDGGAYAVGNAASKGLSLSVCNAAFSTRPSIATHLRAMRNWAWNICF